MKRNPEMINSTAHPKQPDLPSFAASAISKRDQISKTVAPINAVMPPPYSPSFLISVLGCTNGR